MNYINELHKTIGQISTCLPKDVKYTQTKYGGTFKKGNRSIFVDVDLKKNSTAPMKIEKVKNNYGIKLDKKDVCFYSRIDDLIRKGLGIR